MSILCIPQNQLLTTEATLLLRPLYYIRHAWRFTVVVRHGCKYFPKRLQLMTKVATVIHSPIVSLTLLTVV